MKTKNIVTLVMLICGSLIISGIFSRLTINENQLALAYETNEEVNGIRMDLMGTIIEFDARSIQLKESDIFSGIMGESLILGHDIYDDATINEESFFELRLNEETVFRSLETKGFEIITAEEGGVEKLSSGSPVVVFANFYESEFIAESVLIYNFVD